MSVERYMDLVRLRAVIGAVAIVALTLSGCREGDGNRPLSFEQGVYKGEKTRALTEAEQKALSLRGNLQK